MTDFADFGEDSRDALACETHSLVEYVTLRCSLFYFSLPCCDIHFIFAYPAVSSILFSLTVLCPLSYFRLFEDKRTLEVTNVRNF